MLVPIFNYHVECRDILFITTVAIYYILPLLALNTIYSCLSPWAASTPSYVPLPHYSLLSSGTSTNHHTAILRLPLYTVLCHRRSTIRCLSASAVVSAQQLTILSSLHYYSYPALAITVISVLQPPR